MTSESTPPSEPLHDEDCNSRHYLGVCDCSQGLDGLPPYAQITRTDTLVRCNRCGAVVEGDVLGQNQHNIWHDSLDRKIADAARWRPAPRYGGRR